ncbi:MAG: YeeE/YedE family protein [Hellea sp.]|nr:YeeE/YedE family protein [Hellea sp.]
MKQAITGFIAGGVFGAGLLISQMTNPSKVIGFLDFFGNWDPSLGFVMVGALITTFFGYRWVLKKPAPAFHTTFHLPTSKDIDLSLVSGAALFGIGWGLSGLCPGPAVAASTLGGLDILYFLGPMILTIAVYRLATSKSAS